MSSVSARSLDRDAILSALRALAAELGAAHTEVREIRLFGSLARGDRNPYADADILVVLDDSKLSPRDRVPVYKPTSAPVPVDLVVCTAAELEREDAACNRFVGRVLAESLLLYTRLFRAPDQGASGSTEPDHPAGLN